MTIEEAIELVEQLLEMGCLNKVQKVVLRGAWEGQDYKDIKADSGYDIEYLKDVGYKLWKLLSRALDKKVLKKDVRFVLEQYQKEQKEAKEQAIPSAIPLLNGTNLIKHNLPGRQTEVFVNRQQEISQLLRWLADDQASHCLSIQGLGGMGKTTLALTAVQQQLHLPSNFTAIIFVSAKQQNLTPLGILPRLRSDRTLRDIFNAIAHTLNCSDLLLTDFVEQVERMQRLLTQQRILLIVDNLETIDPQEPIFSFLYDLPATVKVLITSREQTPFPAIRLLPLSQAEGLELIHYQAQFKGLSLNSEASLSLYQQTGGVPAAIVYAMGQLAAGQSLHQSADCLTQPTSEFAQFYFQDSIARLRGQLAHRLLLTLAVFSKPVMAETINQVSGCYDLQVVISGLAHLQRLSLIEQWQGRYDMLPLTRGFVLADLTMASNLDQEIRTRWVEWYLKFAVEQGGKDGQEWQDYRELEREWDNLQAVIEWCMDHDRYDEVWQFWQAIKCYSHHQGYRGNRLTYWDTRLDWTEWLIASAEQRQDWAVLGQVLFDQAWTLTLMGQPRHLDAAANQFARAWELRHHQDLAFQSNLAIHIAVCTIQQQEFATATEWLDRARALLSTSTLDAMTVQRQTLTLNYYQGEICYKTQQYQQAQTLFQQVLQQAQTLDWRRAIFLAKDWLADIAIQQKDFSRAQLWLKEGLEEAKSNQDQCRTAFCMRSIAHLEKARGNLARALYWATSAKEKFDRLGMVPEATETEALLLSL